MVDPILLGAVVGVAGTAFGALIGLAAEPIKLWATQRSRKENLRLALYGEMYGIAQFFSNRAATLLGTDNEEFKRALKVVQGASNEISAILQEYVLGSATYDVYTQIKTTDPALFYQLDDYFAIELAYDLLKRYDSFVKRAALSTKPPSTLAEDIEEERVVILSYIDSLPLDKALLKKVHFEDVPRRIRQRSKAHNASQNKG